MTEVIAVIVGAALATVLNSLTESAAWKRDEAQRARLLLPEALRIFWWPAPWVDMQRYLGEMRVRLSAVGVSSSRISILEEAVEVCWRDTRDSAVTSASEDEVGINKDLHDWLREVVSILDQEISATARRRLRKPRPAKLPERPER